MAQSKCPNPRCSSVVFEVKEQKPEGSIHSMYFVQCVKCGTVVGVREKNDIGTMMLRVFDKLGIHTD
jgi:uncharacterized Zn finger protein